MSTLGEMASNIADDINRNDLQSQIERAINRAIFHYRKDRFWFNETTAVLATVADQQTYTSTDGFPSDLLKINVARLYRTSTDTYILTRQSYEWMEWVDPNLSVGPPDYYSVYNTSFYLYPIPDQAYNITLSYLKSYSELSGANDTNDFLSYAEDLIEARAEWWLYSRVLRDPEAAQVMKSAELEALSAIRKMTNSYITRGEISYRE